MWTLSCGPPSFGRDCQLGLALRRQESLGFECSHAALPSSSHRLAIDIVPHEESAYSELFISHLLARNIQAEENLVDQLFNSSEKRLARILLLLANLAPFHSITSLGACTTLSRQSLNTMHGTLTILYKINLSKE